MGDKGIDGITNGGIGWFGNLGAQGSNEGPVLLVFRSFSDPLPDELLLAGVEFEVRVRWRHDLVGIRRSDPLPDEGLFRLAGHECLAAVAFGEGPFGNIEAQVGFPGILVEAVAFEAAV